MGRCRSGGAGILHARLRVTTGRQRSEETFLNTKAYLFIARPRVIGANSPVWHSQRYDGMPEFARVCHPIMQFTEDADPLETREWLDSLASVVQHAGRNRGLHLLNALSAHARKLGVGYGLAPYS